MKKKLFFFIALCLLFSLTSKAQDAELLAARDNVVAFIKSLQYDSGAGDAAGAFRKSNAPAYRDGATDMYFVEPYFTHIACMALLTADETTAVRGWMNWYIGKTTLYNPIVYVGELLGGPYADPLMMNYFYDSIGGNTTTCPPDPPMPAATNCTEIDAEDSDPALFFMVAYKYFQKTEDHTFFDATTEAKLDGFVSFIYDHLYNQTAGLTYAKRAWKACYTMDNSEVYAGLLAYLKIKEEIYEEDIDTPTGGATDPITYAKTMISSIETNIFAQNMYPLSTNLTPDYASYKLFGGGDFDNDGTLDNDCCSGYLSGENMYAFTPMMWPALFGVDDNFNSTAASYTRTLINDAMRGWSEKDWIKSATSGGFWDASVGYFFTLSSDPAFQALGRAQALNAAEVSFRPGIPAGELHISSMIADAAWTLLNLQILINGANDEYILYKGIVNP